MLTINRDELIIYIDAYLNYQAMLRVQHCDEFFIDALTKVIKSNWEDVPEEYEDNSVACAEHMVDTNYRDVWD